MNTIGCVQHDCAECKAREAQTVACEHCDNTGKVLVYGIEESWEEACTHCSGKNPTPNTKPSGEFAQAACKSRSYIDGVEYDVASFQVGYEQGQYDESMAQGPAPTVEKSLIVGEREALIAELRESMIMLDYDPVSASDAMSRAADMLAADAQQVEVPQDVMDALARMCTPLHESRLIGATAEADARSMKIIRDYVLAAAPKPPQADAPPQRQPMTDQELLTQWHAETDAHKLKSSFDWFSAGIRSAETHHGIGERP